MKKTTKPEWIRGRVSLDGSTDKIASLLKELSLNSVCAEADCPNKGECWKKGHVTFLILGDICTRSCLFCNVKKKKPGQLDMSEPDRISEAVNKMGFKYLVLTSVTRDDVKDKGAGHYIMTVNAVKEKSPETMVELLIPDFAGEKDLLKKISLSPVNVIGHNIEIPGSLYSKVRPGSDYKRSLSVLEILNDLKGEDNTYLTKSSMILGLGEKEPEIIETLSDLKRCGVDIVYLGQYLSPSKNHWPVKKYYSPRDFDRLRDNALNMGFKTVFSAPMVRSSYKAKEAYLAALLY